MRGIYVRFLRLPQHAFDGTEMVYFLGELCKLPALRSRGSVSYVGDRTAQIDSQPAAWRIWCPLDLAAPGLSVASAEERVKAGNQHIGSPVSGSLYCTTGQGLRGVRVARR